MCEVGRAELEALNRPGEGEQPAGDPGEERAPRRGREMSREVRLDKDWRQPGVEMWRWLKT